MGKLVLEEWMSLDGHVTDKNGELDFFTNLTPGQNKYSDLDQLKFLDAVDTIILGRKTYELFVDFWPTATTEKEVIADKLNMIKKIVISNTITGAPWGNWSPAEVMNGNVIDNIRQLKSQPGKNMVLWGSISIAQTLMSAGLIDEYHIQLCPVVTGGGTKLFTKGTELSNLHLQETRQYDTGVVFLNYVAV